MKYKSVFDVIGPVMIGPSSSHTAGAVRIGQIARKIFGEEPESIVVHFYGSFAETYKGHATDVAVIGGIMAYETDDMRIQNSLQIAEAKGIQIEFHKEEAVPVHPNTVKLILEDNNNKMELTGISIGGGAIQITDLNGFPLKLSGENPSILILHKDAYGSVAAIANILAKHCINISHMEVSRIERGHHALMVIETDQEIKEDLVQEMSSKDNIIKVIVLST